MADVRWREWGEDAFAESRALGKPILLDIGAVWCHWCHVMDHGIPGDAVHTGTYSNPQVAELINRDFIPVKVDNDKRPDINARYNMGGWPTTAFLTPDGDPLYGATYLTPQQMLGLLEQIAEYYRENQSEITERVKERRVQEQAVQPPRGSGTSVTEEIVDHVAHEVRRSFDPAYGGFGMQPKFPHPEAINLALVQYARTAEDELRQVAERTLFGMASGGMYDEFAGGFFRYSTTRDWSIPHYEKMLQDNTRLLSTNLNAYQILGDERYLRIAEDVARFLLEVMYNGDLGTFAGSQDADKEEDYYGLSLDERAKLPTPFIDWTVYADWNSLAVSAMVELYRQTGDDHYLSTATRLYDFLTSHVAPSHYYSEGKRAGTKNGLTDLSALVAASLDLFETTGLRRYLDEGRGLADIAISELYDEETKRFRDFPLVEGALGALNTARFDLEENAHASRQLLRLTALTSSGRYKRIAENVLGSFANSFRESSYFASGFALAAAALLAPAVQVVIVGDLSSDATTALKLAAFRTFAFNKTVELRSPEDSGDYLPDAEGRSIAYVCIDTTCSRPTAEPSELVELLKG
jgi:uncharacterized protein